VDSSEEESAIFKRLLSSSIFQILHVTWNQWKEVANSYFYVIVRRSANFSNCPPPYPAQLTFSQGNFEFMRIESSAMEEKVDRLVQKLEGKF
jgi:hypothetical protein